MELYFLVLLLVLSKVLEFYYLYFQHLILKRQEKVHVEIKIVVVVRY